MDSGTALTPGGGGGRTAAGRHPAHRGDRHHGDQHEGDDGEQLGHQQPGAAGGPDQQVAQRARLRLPGHRVAADDGDRDRQEQRQHDAQRRQREQLAVVQHREQEGRPLARAGREVGDLQQHRDQHRQRVERRDRAPRPRPAERLAQLDADHRRRPPSTRSALAPAAASTTCSSVGRSGRSPVTGTPAPTSSALTSAGPLAADHQPLAVGGGDPAVEHRPRPVGRPGWRRRCAPVGAVSAASSSCSTSRPRSSTPTRRAQLLDLGQQVAGQEDRRPGAVQVEQQLADLGDALRVQAVGRLVEHQQLGAAQQGAGEARAAGACPASTPSPAAGRRRPAPPAPARPRSAGAGCAAAPPGPAASSSRRFSAPERCP